MKARFFIIDPLSAEDALSKALAIARCADAMFNPGNWARPCSIEIPDSKEDADSMRSMLIESKLKFHESSFDEAL